MTRFERLQKKTTFKTAGFNAFGLMIQFKDNPYTLQPFKDIWSDGYHQAQRSAKRQSTPIEFHLGRDR
jgi:hypothetical protein